ncbi:MAG: cation transporting ATPase C-terminal domain-containing protein [Methanothrix sp.]|nr:cation transporting ATPase C-terminal domain-containing protein [Methanothrix sp.]
MSTPNPALWWVVGSAIVFLALAIYVPFIREIFGFAYLHHIDVAICFMAGIASVLWFEGLKIINR